MKSKKLVKSKKSEEVDTSDSYASYLEYNKLLRLWFVGFGAGSLTLFITNDTLVAKLAKTGHLGCVVLLLFLGIGLQVTIAGLNKYANWGVYSRHLTDPPKSTWQYIFSEWIIEKIEIDLAFDVGTMFFFLAATILMVWALISLDTVSSNYDPAICPYFMYAIAK